MVTLTVEQCDVLEELSKKHNAIAHVRNIEHKHIEVEFAFPDRYIVTTIGTIFKAYDLEYNKYRRVSNV